MNAFNRLIMLLIALLLIAVPVLLLLIGFGILPANQISPYYRPALESLGGLASVFSYDAGARTVVGLIGILVFLVALFLLLKEIPLGRRIARSTLIEEEPGRETAITSGAVRQLAEAAAREAGADSPPAAWRPRSAATTWRATSGFRDRRTSPNSRPARETTFGGRSKNSRCR